MGRIWLGSIIDENVVRKSTRTRRKPVMTNVDFNNKRYDDGDIVDGTIHMNIPDEEPGMTEGDLLRHVFGVVMLNYFSIKSGINRYGEAGKQAVDKELQQLHGMDTYEPMDPDKFTRLERTKSLASLMFLVEKRNGLIKLLQTAANIGKKRVTKIRMLLRPPFQMRAQ